MGLEEGTLLARGALSTLNRERRYWLEELRKTCNAIQARNVLILSEASLGKYQGGMIDMAKQQSAILEKLAEIEPQIIDLKQRAWGEK